MRVGRDSGARPSPQGTFPFLGRRAVAQAGLLAAVVAVLVCGCAIVGTSALLLTVGREAALDAALAGAEPATLGVEVTFRLTADEQPAVVEVATEALREAVAPMDPQVSVWVTSAVRPLEDDATHAYLVGASDAAAHAELLEGRWPESAGGAVLEVVVPEVAARQLGLETGDTLVLHGSEGTATTDGPGTAAQPLRVVGVFRPLDAGGPGWQADVLQGSGTATGWKSSPSVAGPGVDVVGPLLVDPGALLAADDPAAVRASLRMSPGQLDLDAAERGDVRGELGGLQRDLRTTLGDRTDAERVRAPLVVTLDSAAGRDGVAASVVLVVALVDGALAGAALGLAGRLMAVRRADELALLAARGGSRAQLVTRAALEAGAVALVASALAVPLSIGTYRWVGAVADAPGRAVATVPLVLAVGAAALALAVALVAPTWRAAETAPRGRRSVRARAARVTLDVALLALAVAAYLQLRAHPFSTSGGADPVLVLAPTLCLVAGAVLALRLVPWVARRAEVRAVASRRLVLPMATWEVARRRHSTGAALLLVVAAASGTFAVALDQTWSQSLTDQADAASGGDLEVTRDDLAPVAHQLALVAATGGDVLPVVDRGVRMGSLSADVAEEARLLAFDTTTAARTLHGRLPRGTDWASLAAGLVPEVPGQPIALPAGARTLDVTLVGVIDDIRPLSMRPTFVVRSAEGAFATVTGDAVPADGAPHELSVSLPAEAPTKAPAEARSRLSVVAVRLAIDLARTADQPIDWAPSDDTDTLEVTVTLPGASLDATGEGSWAGAMTSPVDNAPRGIAVSTSSEPRSAVVTARGPVRTGFISYAETSFLLTDAPAPSDVPVALSAGLAELIAAEPGDLLALDVEDAEVTARVVGVLPAFAALPHGATILADRDALARAVLPITLEAELTDAWWVTGVGDPPTAAAAVRAAGLGDVVARADLVAAQRADPFRALVRAALVMLVAAACTLAMAGTVLQTAATLRLRAVDVARLLGMGVPARSVTAALGVEHALVSALVTAAGCAVGALCARFVAPLLVVSVTGGAPVPSARPVWPWPVEAVVLAVLLLGCAAVAVPVAAGLVRRARATHLRMDVP